MGHRSCVRMDIGTVFEGDSATTSCLHRIPLGLFRGCDDPTEDFLGNYGHRSRVRRWILFCAYRARKYILYCPVVLRPGKAQRKKWGTWAAVTYRADPAAGGLAFAFGLSDFEFGCRTLCPPRGRQQGVLALGKLSGPHFWPDCGESRGGVSSVIGGGNCWNYSHQRLCHPPRYRTSLSANPALAGF